MKKITIAIDGFSSCGKSTMAKDLAREVGYIYIDSGAMYRAVFNVSEARKALKMQAYPGIDHIRVAPPLL